ncbi:MAG: nucleotide exchange factor GrpE [Candidatus Sericytochromatia bacterium]|nr:nucleotide exchange factor GrpE [Candidatus Tanganyikabacteria bacterium]
MTLAQGREEEPEVTAEGFVQPIEEAEVRRDREEAVGEAGTSPEALAAEVARVRDQLLRARADLDNWRKNYERELSRALIEQRRTLLLAFLPVADNLGRALAALEGEGDVAAVRKGVAMVRRSFLEALEREGVRPLEARGDAFDPRLHEAVGTRDEAPEHAGRVVAVVEAGFMFDGEILRPARVLVGAGPEATHPERSDSP